MRGLFKNKPFVIMLIAIVLLGILAFATSGERSVSWLESTVGAVVQPVQTFASKASDSIIGFFSASLKQRMRIRHWNSFRRALRSLKAWRRKTKSFGQKTNA